MYPNYTINIHYKCEDGGRASIEYRMSASRLEVVASAARQAGYYQGLGNTILECSITSGSGSTKWPVAIPNSMRESLGI